MSSLLVPLLWATLGSVEHTQQAADTVYYVLAEGGRFDVHTRKAGIFGFAGHDHLVRVAPGGLRGEVIDVAADRSKSRVRLEVATDSLRVLTAADLDDIPKITEAMREKVLRVDDYPTITFISTSSRPADGGVELRGDLTLVGQTRPVSVRVMLSVVGDTLRATGRFSVKQREFGIKPYSTAAGTVQVADEITFDFEALAVARPDG